MKHAELIKDYNLIRNMFTTAIELLIEIPHFSQNEEWEDKYEKLRLDLNKYNEMVEEEEKNGTRENY